MCPIANIASNRARIFPLQQLIPISHHMLTLLPPSLLQYAQIINKTTVQSCDWIHYTISVRTRSNMYVACMRVASPLHHRATDFPFHVVTFEVTNNSAIMQFPDGVWNWECISVKTVSKCEKVKEELIYNGIVSIMLLK